MNCEHCGSTNYKKNGFFSTEGGSVQRYRCKNCGLDFCDRSGEETKYEKRPELDDEIVALWRNGLSQREIAKRLGCARRTVQLKIRKYVG